MDSNGVDYHLSLSLSNKHELTNMHTYNYTSGSNSKHGRQ